MLKSLLIGLSCLFLLSACSGNDEAEKILQQADITDEELYREGVALLDNNRYQSAIESFQEIERLYPFSPLATKAQIMVAYSYYRDEEYDLAVQVIDRFTRLHPGNPDIGYMYYLKAISYYERITDVARDQAMTQKALQALEEVMRRFPETNYARDAKLKRDLVRDHLAGKEMEIGRFYLKRGKHVAAINRFKNVINDFERTSHTPEALYRMTEAYLTIGVPQEAKKYASVLGHNFSKSKWYRYAYRLIGEGKDTPTPKGDGFLQRFWPASDETPEPELDTSGSLPRDDKAENWLQRIKNIF